MNTQSEEERFINDNVSRSLLVAEEADNILEHALTEIRTLRNNQTNLSLMMIILHMIIQ